MHTEDTIAAIATPPGEGSIAVVRISGPESVTIASRITRCGQPPLAARPSHSVTHGYVIGDGPDIDEVLILIMRAPHTFTGEDVVEIQGHGGNIPARRVLRRALQAGARAAEPGEYTRRAFLNGRIDLVQAEAVLDLVKSSSERAAGIAIRQLEGGLSIDLKRIYDDMLLAASDVAVLLDFPEEDIHPGIVANTQKILAGVEKRMESLLATWDEGRILRNGALVVISGMANVGKSTLLNALLKYDRAIVSHIPGTTRDFIEETLCLNGVPVRLVDTAGLRQSECDLELEGIRRARQQVEKADLHLYVVDASEPLSPADAMNIQTLYRKSSIIILNKADKGLKVNPSQIQDHDCVVSALTQRIGLEDIRASIGCKLDEMLSPPPDEGAGHAAVSERHRALLEKAKADLDKSLSELESCSEDSLFLASENLRSAAEHVASILGLIYDENLLDQIFSRFCIGK